ncbi:gibberellin A4 carboxyl methyltransferase [Sarracenia purpurea var. burkii]
MEVFGFSKREGNDGGLSKDLIQLSVGFWVEEEHAEEEDWFEGFNSLRVPPGIYDEQGKSINKGKIYISESSPPQVSEAYFRQFQEDFSLFLRSRSKELINGGRMVFILMGRMGSSHAERNVSFWWELLSRSLSILVSQGKIEEEKLDSYNIHYYAPSQQELEDEIGREGFFQVERLETFEIEKVALEGITSYGSAVARTIRAVQESMLSHHFGEGILDDLFHHFGRLVDEEMEKEEMRTTSFVVALRKK